MSWSIKLFQVRGIDVKVHLTFFLILVWAAYRWGSSAAAGVQGALFGVVVTLLLFAAVTLHELGHSLTALRYGVRVRDITLMPLGGLARMDEMPQKPGQELRISLAGPAVNVAIAAILVVVAAILNQNAIISFAELGQSLGQTSWAGMLAYLTMANLYLAAFNLIPAFPMDGGRVLRALLAMKFGHAMATSIAAAVGQGAAFLLGLWGFMSGSFTLVLIAVFIWMGAGEESKDAQVKSVLRGLTVDQAMTRQPVVLYPDEKLTRAVELTLNTAQADFPVLARGNGHLLGVMISTDLVRALREKGAEAKTAQVMRTEYYSARPTDPLIEVQKRMTEARAQAAPVLENGKLVGLLTAADINEAYRLLSASPSLRAIAG